jgi:hypothetical protein
MRFVYLTIFAISFVGMIRTGSHVRHQIYSLYNLQRQFWQQHIEMVARHPEVPLSFRLWVYAYHFGHQLMGPL